MSPLYWLGHILMSLLQNDSDSEGQMALVLAQAAINKIPEFIFSPVWRLESPRSRFQQDSALMKALAGLSMTSLSSQGPSTSTHWQKKQGNFHVSYFYKDSNLVGSGLWPLWPHLCFIFSFKSPSSHTTTLRVRVLVYEFWGDTDIQPIPLSPVLQGKRDILQKPLLIPTIKLTIPAASDIAISSFLLLQHRMEEFLCLPLTWL